MRSRTALVALAVLPVLAACGSGGAGGAAGEPCGALPTADPAATLPGGFPALPGQVLYGPATQGKTSVVFGLLPREDFVAVRDELVDGLEKAGYQVVGTDQEAVEAEAEFAGPHEGTVKVQPLCAGHLTVRYKVTG